MRRKINQFKKKHRMTQMIAVLMFLFTFSIINVMKTMQEKNVEKRKSILKTDIKDMKTKEQYQTSADKIHHIRLTAKLEQIIEGTATETIQN